MKSVKGTIIKENEINSGGCNKCQKITGVPMKQIGTIIIGTYILFATVYGTIVIINKIKDLFN